MLSAPVKTFKLIGWSFAAEEDNDSEYIVKAYRRVFFFCATDLRLKTAEWPIHAAGLNIYKTKRRRHTAATDICNSPASVRYFLKVNPKTQ